ncbi:MAG: hypothetical protein M3450_13550 [Actinomycetota bacterium]|nr:hypothetical protein [Actinomycetota bacterium]MDQ3642451.1 hypothetical protein [Actinomycetota bacterium]
MTIQPFDMDEQTGLGRPSRSFRRPLSTVGSIGLVLLLGACASGDSETTTTGAPTTVATTAPPTTAPPTTGPSLPAPSRREATQALCQEIGAAQQMVASGRAAAGGLRLSRAVNAYEKNADPGVVQPARRMLATAVRGDLEASASAAREASTACARVGHRPAGAPAGAPAGGQVRCFRAPCP